MSSSDSEVSQSDDVVPEADGASVYLRACLDFHTFPVSQVREHVWSLSVFLFSWYTLLIAKIFD